MKVVLFECSFRSKISDSKIANVIKTKNTSTCMHSDLNVYLSEYSQLAHQIDQIHEWSTSKTDGRWTDGWLVSALAVLGLVSRRASSRALDGSQSVKKITSDRKENVGEQIRQLGRTTCKN
jgi:hypothetical protein